jgi:hypothetical protein
LSLAPSRSLIAKTNALRENVKTIWLDKALRSSRRRFLADLVVCNSVTVVSYTISNLREFASLVVVGKFVHRHLIQLVQDIGQSIALGATCGKI